jgi:SOS-response transcriptional repressor LexA
MFKTRAGAFCLKVRGDSMIEEQIRDGDLGG